MAPRASSTEGSDDKAAVAPVVRPSFREMFDANFAYVSRAMRRLGVAPVDIEDAVQEVFAAIYGKWNGYDPQRPLRPWLFSFAFRVAANWRRRAQRAPEGGQDIVEFIDQRSPEQAAIEQETRALVLAVLDRMPFERRDVLVMHDIEGLDAKAVAQVLDIPVNTVYSRLRVARQEFEAGIARKRRKGT
jgi:RNA polymerase sigma-70 factor (ECF subfamily)